MKIGYLTSCLKEASPAEQLKWAAENGFSALEIAVTDAESESAGTGAIGAAELGEPAMGELRRCATECGIEISCLSYFANMLDPDEAARMERLKTLEKVVEAAALLDVDNVSCFAGRNPQNGIEQNLDQLQEVFGDLVQRASDKGVRMAIENFPALLVTERDDPIIGNIAYSPVMWRAIFRRIPALGLNLDPSHLVWLGIDYLAAVREFAGHIYHVHAKDTEILDPVLADAGILSQEPRWWRYRLPGFGSIDWARFLSALVEGGYDGAISIEHEDPVFSGEEEKVREGLLRTKRFLEEYTT